VCNEQGWPHRQSWFAEWLAVWPQIRARGPFGGDSLEQGESGGRTFQEGVLGSGYEAVGGSTPPGTCRGTLDGRYGFQALPGRLPWGA
jgi:hypothetical protein